MRIRVRHAVYLVAATLLVGCSAGSSASATSHRVTTASSSAGAAARATVTPSATGRPSQGLLGVLAVPAGATPWPSNVNGPKSLTAFVELCYAKSSWIEEEAQYVRRGFLSAVLEGWDNPDGSQQDIRLARFATPAGAASAFDEAGSAFRREPKPATVLTDPATGAVGWSSPALDTQGNASVEFTAVVGDIMILVYEETAATPDPAAAKELLQRQYDSLKNGS